MEKINITPVSKDSSKDGIGASEMVLSELKILQNFSRTSFHKILEVKL